MVAYEEPLFSVIVPSTIDLLAAHVKDPFIMVVGPSELVEDAIYGIIALTSAVDGDNIRLRQKTAAWKGWIFSPIVPSTIDPLAAL